ncbi:SPOR domain-containing protein [Candidatus Latescibacterota bacterium]
MVLLLSLMLTGCGSGLPYSRIQRTSSPADQIDPFEYGDEFLSATTTDDDLSPPREMNAFPTDADQSSNGNASQDTQQSGQTVQSSTMTAEPSLYQIQLGGVFENKEDADRYAQRARQRLDRPISVEYRAPFFRVIAGSFTQQRDAEAYISYLKEHGFQDSRWILSGTPSP